MKSLITIALFACVCGSVAQASAKPIFHNPNNPTAAQEAARFASLFPARSDSFDTGGVNCPAVVVGECHSHPNK